MITKKVFIIGPTASGKTELAKYIYDKFKTELISVDSAQIYKGMDIGTAKPKKNELKEYPHHLIDIKTPIDNYSVAEFKKDVGLVINNISSEVKFTLFVGGTMMYFNSLDNPLDDLPVSNKEIRSQVNLELKKNGLAGLFNKLRKIDPVSAKKINQFDTQRIQRAMEVFYLSGKPLSAFHSNSQKLIAVNATLKIGLFPSNRESLNKLIEKRVEYMLRVGLIDEVRGIVKDYPGINDTYSSIRSVGYRQTYQFLDNQILEEDLKDKIIFATRQLAKRQMTWMRKMQNLESFDPFDSDLKLKIKKRIQLFLK